MNQTYKQLSIRWTVEWQTTMIQCNTCSSSSDPENEVIARPQKWRHEFQCNERLADLAARAFADTGWFSGHGFLRNERLLIVLIHGTWLDGKRTIGLLQFLLLWRGARAACGTDSFLPCECSGRRQCGSMFTGVSLFISPRLRCFHHLSRVTLIDLLDR